MSSFVGSWGRSLSLQSLVLTPVLLFLLLVCSQCFLEANALSRDELFPFGDSAGDESILRNDDDNSPVLCSDVPYTFFTRKRHCFFVNNNGIISFSSFLRSYSVRPFPLEEEFQTISVFYSDVDTRAVGQLFFRITTDPQIRERVDMMVNLAFPNEGSFQSRSVTVATWDGVGSYPEGRDLLNTFQCVLASDGESLYSIHLYQDIQWIRVNTNNSFAQVGFNAGDGVSSYTLPDSQTEAVRNVTLTSNVGMNGLWVFRVSGPSVEVGGCLDRAVDSSNGVVPTTISPNYGNQLGASLVTVRGPCFSSLSNIQCDFDGQTIVALYSSESVVHCTTPSLPRSGRVPFRLLIDGVVRGEAFYTVVSMEQAHQVDLMPTSEPPQPLLLMGGASLTLTWTPEHVFPQSNGNQDPFNLDIILFTFDTDTEQWMKRNILAENVPNDGSEEVVLPEGISDSDIVPIAIKVATSLHPSTRFGADEVLYMRVFRSQQRVGIWTSEYYYAGPEAAGTSKRNLCQEWYDQEPNNLPASLTIDSTPCSPTLEQAAFPTSGLTAVSFSGLYRDHWYSTFHQGSVQCFKGATAATISRPTEQECCYDNKGFLITGASNGGAVKKVSKDVSRARHFMEDVRPYLLCCTGLAPNCGLYYTKRPSDDASRFDPPTPGWMIGDPHIVTLDQLRYTFNGHGEFTLLQTPDSSFTLQGRMIPFDNRTAEDGGTVFSAVAARVGVAGDRVTIMSAGSRKLDVYVNDELVKFASIPERSFSDFSVALVGQNGTVTLQFGNGVYLECRVDSTGRFMTGVIVGVPQHLRGGTSGLLGVFNGIQDDDLMPALSDSPLPADSDLYTIHHSFGLTWMIENVSQSLFTYLPYESLAGFSNSSYSPLFDVTFSQDVLNRCNNDSFCAYDVSVTESDAFGMQTLGLVEEARRIEQGVALNVVCNPPCSNGACVPGNMCACPRGFSGPQCQNAHIEECAPELNPCKSGERCFVQADSYNCVLDCQNFPNSELCAPVTLAPSSNTATIIIACSVVGVTIILIVVILSVSIVCCFCLRKGGSSKKTEVGSSNELGKMDGLDTLRKVSNTLPPAYSDLEMNKFNIPAQTRGDSTEPVLRYITRLNEELEPHPQEEPEYANLPRPATADDKKGSRQSFKEPMPLPPSAESSVSSEHSQPRKGRRSSLGVQPSARRPSLGLPPHAELYQGRLSPSERARSHNVISISPDSDESGSPKGIKQSDKRHSKSVTVSPQQSLQPQQQLSLPTRDDWYRSSTPTISPASIEARSSSLQPPLSPTSHTSGGSSMAGFPVHNQAPSATTSHKSLQFSFSNPNSHAKNATRSQSSMGQSATLNGGYRMGNGGARSAYNVNGRYMPRASSSMGRNRSVPAAMDQLIDDKITDV